MFGPMRERMTFANTVSLIAVFVALGGTSYAAVKIPRNSVGSAQIKTGGVGSGDVKNGALRAVDFRAGELPQGPAGPAGAQGEKGDKGDTGAVGGFGQSTVQFEQAAAALADNSSASYDVHCPAGMQGISGGARGDATDSEFTNVTSSRPKISETNSGAPVDGGTFNGWRVTVLNPTGGAPPGGAILPEVWVTCVPAPRRRRNEGDDGSPVRSQLKLGNVLPLLALFAALGGTSYAAVKVSRNTVGASQIKAIAVSSSDVKNGALRRIDLRRPARSARSGRSGRRESAGRRASRATGATPATSIR